MGQVFIKGTDKGQCRDDRGFVMVKDQSFMFSESIVRSARRALSLPLLPFIQRATVTLLLG